MESWGGGGEVGATYLMFLILHVKSVITTASPPSKKEKKKKKQPFNIKLQTHKGDDVE